MATDSSASDSLAAGAAASDDDTDISVDDLDLRAPQGEAVAARLAAGAQVELPAVPGADDIPVDGVVLQGARLAACVHRLAHPAKDAALTDRPAAMGALIVPGDEFAIDVEDADFGAVAGNDPAVAVDVFGTWIAATVTAEPLYDAASARVKGVQTGTPTTPTMG